MSRYINIDDVGLRKTIAVGGLSAKALWRRIQQEPSIDIVRCAECKYRERCEQIVVFDIGENQVEGRKIDFCSYGKRKESE